MADPSARDVQGGTQDVQEYTRRGPFVQCRFGGQQRRHPGDRLQRAVRQVVQHRAARRGEPCFFWREIFKFEILFENRKFRSH